MKQSRSIAFLAFLLIAAQLLVSCSQTKPDPFDAQIAALDYTASGYTIPVSSMEELMEKMHPNLIVRAIVKERGASMIMDYSGKYTTDTLSAQAEDVQQIASAFLSTPYELEIREVLLGEVLPSHITEGEIGQAASSDTVTLYAPYGILGDFTRRDGEHPILEVGKEYLLFLRVDEIYGQLSYYLAYSSGSALELTGNTFTGEYRVPTIFGEYATTKELLADLARLIAANDYDLSIESVGGKNESVQ